MEGRAWQISTPGTSRRALSAEEVYVFSVTLCDNEVDRDFERFSIPALQGLAPLFLGKSGIFDHDRKASGQSALDSYEDFIISDYHRLLPSCKAFFAGFFQRRLSYLSSIKVR